MIPLLSACAFLALNVSEPTAADVLQPGFKDASFELKVVQANFAELRKIDDDFDKQYRLNSLKLQVKEPLMLRIDARVEDTNVLYIVNGFRRLSRIPRSGINIKEDLRKAPGKIQTPLDFGVLTPGVVALLFDVKFVRTDRATGDYVFDFTYKRPKFDDTSRYRIWFDPDKKYTVKREDYNQYGRQLATFYYEKPVQQDGIWMPTRATVKNVEGKVAGVTEVSGLKVNSGLPESLFAIK